MLASLPSLFLGFSAWSTCPSYDAISTPEARQLDPHAYAGFWYEVQSANVFLADGCHCTRYNWTLTSNTTFADTFKCHKGSATGSVTTIPNHGSFPAAEPGKMVESLGPVSPACAHPTRTSLIACARVLADGRAALQMSQTGC